MILASKIGREDIIPYQHAVQNDISKIRDNFTDQDILDFVKGVVQKEKERLEKAKQDGKETDTGDSK